MISFTIITCTYNAATVLQRTLDSVLRQTYPCIEHIVQDGLSEDETCHMVEEYKDTNDVESPAHNVTLYSEKDTGLYDAMNRALQRATGDYVVFLNAGDKLPCSSTLEQLAAAIDKHQPLPGVLYGDTDIVDNDGNFLYHRHLTPPQHLTWKSFRQGMLVCHQAFYVRSDVARATPYNVQYRFSSDVDWCIRVMKRCKEQHLTLLHSGLLLCHYLEGGLSKQYHRASLKERFKVMCRHYGIVSTVLMHLWFAIRTVAGKNK